MIETDQIDSAVLEEMKLQYLLKELELRINAENEGRNRAEQLIQFFLTAFTAIVGAMLVIIPIKRDFLLTAITIFLGSTAIVAFGAFTFVRACIYREGISLVRLKIFLIRQILLDHGVRPAQLVLLIDSKPNTGFSPRVFNFLMIFSAFFGLVASIATVAGIVILLRLTNQIVFYASAPYLAIYGIPALASFLICFGVLVAFARRYRRNSNLLLKEYSILRRG